MKQSRKRNASRSMMMSRWRSRFRYAAMLALALCAGLIVHVIYSWVWWMVLLWLLAIGQG